MNQSYYQLFHDGGLYHMETSPLICKENQWTNFYIKAASVIKELKLTYKRYKYI